jgi:hypothetical protein
MALIRSADGENEQQCQGRPGYECQQLWLCERKDVVHLQCGGHAELVDEVRHEGRVGLEGDKSRRTLLWVGICVFRHGFVCLLCW